MTPAARFEDIWRQHSADVFRFAYYLSGDRTVAEDLTSETFLRAWSTEDRLRLETVKGYLLAIARNLFLESKRRDWRRQPLDTAGDVRSQPSGVESRIELEHVRLALQQLPEHDRMAILLRAEEALPYEEIARILTIPVATVKVKVHRGRLRLAEITGRNWSRV